MSYNIFYNSRGKGTFQDPQAFMAPPQQYFSSAQPLHYDITDEDIIKQFENKIPKVQPVKLQNPISISKVRDQIRNLALALNEIKLKQKLLTEKITTLSDNEWCAHLKEVENNKEIITKTLSDINNLNTDILRKLLALRCSKRARQKRQRVEKRKHKEELKRQNEEKSRKIDEYLKKFQDEINKAKQEDEAKIQADAVLKETIRKKQDAKKYIVKLEALVKLRRARMNTAKGRGETVSQKEGEVFEVNIEKLKSMWSRRLTMYEKEESELRTKLARDCGVAPDGNETEKEVQRNLELWRSVLFGGKLPQVEFTSIDEFLAVRSQWDQYLHPEGSSIPVGWVPPASSKCELKRC